VFRFEPERVVRALDPTSTIAVPNQMTPVVYRLNLRDAASLFFAQSFRIQNRDLLYVSTSPITDAQKVMEVVALITGPTLTGLSTCAYIKC
jgi:polysaccharide export outer membrane protein